MQVSETIEFTNASGVTYRFGGLVSVEGLGDVEADIQEQSAPYQDGSAFIDALLTPRYVNLEFILRGANYEEVRSQRSFVGKAVNPKLGLGTLRYISGNTTREIEAVAESVPFFPDGTNRGERWQRGTLTFKCPNPYWKSLGETEEPTFEPLFQFPFEGEFQMGMQRDRRIIINDGDSPTPIFVEFHGPALNPKIVNNTTGEFIKINQLLNEDERMVIDTTDGKKSVFFVDALGNRRNVFHWIDLDSTFFKLEVGENDIEYSADSDVQGAVVNISYNKLYTAI